jgi:hypothetical protein
MLFPKNETHIIRVLVGYEEISQYVMRHKLLLKDQYTS